MSHFQRRRASRGTCRHCMRRRDVFSVGRSGGGTYRRGGRNYSSSICAGCALGLLAWAGGSSGSVSRFDRHDLERIVASLGTDEAAEVLTAYRERRDRVRWSRERRAAEVGA